MLIINSKTYYTKNSKYSIKMVISSIVSKRFGLTYIRIFKDHYIALKLAQQRRQTATRCGTNVTILTYGTKH